MNRLEKQPAGRLLTSADAHALPLLADIVTALARRLDLSAAVQEVLDLLVRDDAVFAAMVAVRQGRCALRVESHSDRQRHPSMTRAIDDGIIERVVGSACPIVVPNVDPRHPAGHERGVIAVPIQLNRAAIGGLGVDIRFTRERDYDTTAAFLCVVASLIAQAVDHAWSVEDMRQRFEWETSHLRQELRGRYDLPNVIGSSGNMRSIFEQIARLATLDSEVLLRGESGTGKRLLARTIHYNSTRATKPFVEISCAGRSEWSVEADIFGTFEEAFAGADREHAGRLELARGGTVCLNDIDTLSPGMQVKLLRVLHDQEFERPGGIATITTNVRIVATTEANLESALASGTFRADLYRRFQSSAVFVPPLRERKTDLPALVDCFVQRFSQQQGKPIKRISPSALELLTSYHWPGNVTELEHVLEKSVVTCEGHVLQARHLSPILQPPDGEEGVTGISLEEAVEACEKDLIHDALKKTRGNRSKAARLLKTTERILKYKVDKLGIDSGRYRFNQPSGQVRHG